MARGEGLQNTVVVRSPVWTVHRWTPYSARVVPPLCCGHARSLILVLVAARSHPYIRSARRLWPPPSPPRGGQGCFAIGNETSERVKEQNDVRAVSQVSFLLQATDSTCIPLSFRALVSLPLVRVLRRAEISIMTETGPRKQRNVAEPGSCLWPELKKSHAWLTMRTKYSTVKTWSKVTIRLGTRQKGNLSFRNA